MVKKVVVYWRQPLALPFPPSSSLIRFHYCSRSQYSSVQWFLPLYLPLIKQSQSFHFLPHDKLKSYWNYGAFCYTSFTVWSGDGKDRFELVYESRNTPHEVRIYSFAYLEINRKKKFVNVKKQARTVSDIPNIQISATSEKLNSNQLLCLDNKELKEQMYIFSSLNFKFWSRTSRIDCFCNRN